MIDPEKKMKHTVCEKQRGKKISRKTPRKMIRKEEIQNKELNIVDRFHSEIIWRERLTNQVKMKQT